MIQKKEILLVFFLVVHFLLSIYGNDWGLPSRWNADEKVANVLHMAEEKVLYDSYGSFFHPTGYHIFLLVAFVPAYIYLKMINYPLMELKKAASISWIEVEHLFSDFSTGIYLYARTLSALLGVFLIYLIYLLGKHLYDQRIGIFSAAFLSVCMGIIGINHFAKYSSLQGVCLVLTILLALLALKDKNEKKLLLAFLCGGFSTAVHINGPLLLLPL